MIDFEPVQALSFDCYGTLIDWERGLLDALRPVLARHGVSWTDDAVVQCYGEIEAALQRQAYRPYREILRLAVEGIARDAGFVAEPTEQRCLEESLPHWPPFPDTVSALRALQQRFRLIILSNIDDDLFAATERRLGVKFDLVVTAQQVRAYKPSLDNFRELLRRSGLDTGRLVHVAQSLFHDAAPARQLGLATVWVNRRQGRIGVGSEVAETVRADLEVPDLAALASLAIKPATFGGE